MNEDKNKKQSFFEKMKTDKKYNAKVQLMGYGLLIIFIIIYANVSSYGSTYDYNNVLDNTISDEDVVEEESDLLEELENNYSYNIDIDVKKYSDDENLDEDTDTSDDIEKTTVEYSYNYNGKSYEDNLIINKLVNDTSVTYYKVDDLYYSLDDEEYILIDEDVVYDLIEKEYIEVSGVKKYIDKASLDHFTSYSSGRQEYVYNLKVSDVIQSYKGDDVVGINILVENNIISIEVDYTNLLVKVDEDYVEVKVTYTYENINEIEEFVITFNESEDNNE